jgi:3-deoxy-D-manno-octulosonic acid (KDO) 8-phosphate synthase
MANLKLGGSSTSALALNALPNPKRATSRAPRMLTPSEIAPLRQHKQAVANIAKKRFAPAA